MCGSFNLETCPSNTQADASNRMLKKSANGVLASLSKLVKREM